MLAVGKPPAVQHRLLHGGDEKAAVGAHGGAEMRALPFELFRRGLRRVGKPQRGAVVMRDGKPKALRQEGEPADGRRRFEFAQLLGLHEGRLAGRPGDRAVGRQRDMIDPAMFRIGRERAGLALRVGRDHAAVVAAADDALAIGGRGEDRAVMDGDPPRLAVGSPRTPSLPRRARTRRCGQENARQRPRRPPPADGCDRRRRRYRCGCRSSKISLALITLPWRGRVARRRRAGWGERPKGGGSPPPGPPSRTDLPPPGGGKKVIKRRSSRNPAGFSPPADCGR